MFKYRLATAISLGVGLTSSLVLLINVPFFPAVLASTLLLTPGGILADIIHRWQPVPLWILCSSVFYAGIAFGALILLNIDVRILRRILVSLTALAALAFSLVCIPRFNPLLPKGIDELERREYDLRTSFPPGMTADEARTALAQRKIEFKEWVSEGHSVIVGGPKNEFTSEANDRVFWAKIPSNAGQFPCGFGTRFALLFGSDNKLKKQHVERFPICP